MNGAIPLTLLTRQAAKHQQSQITKIILEKDLHPECLAILGTAANWLGALANSSLLPSSKDAKA